ncbi:MAG: TldD/PmbA family protein [Candidatus Heimdallarchaeota archaeon]|nr:TldD/PmbA family protein [Candidatus Heimdallarchaeota archaeon]
MGDFFQKVINMGLKKGADQIEFFVLEGFTDIIQLENNGIKVSESKTITGIGVRAYSKKGLGIATTSLLGGESIKEIVSKAVKLSKLSPPDTLFKTLPGPFDSYPQVEGLFDEEIINLPDEKLTEMAIEAIDCANESHNKVIASGNFNRTYATETIYNSMGVEVSQKLSSLSGVIFVKAQKKSDISTSWDYQKTRNLRSFQPDKIGREAANNAISLLGSKKIKTDELPIILDARSTLDTMSSIVSNGLDAYEVILGTAYFKDHIGEQITNEAITLIDNPLYPGGVGSAIFDDEGVPHSELTLIENGIAKAYFSNSFCANVLGIQNTAHASKTSLSSKPHPDLSQIQIKPGQWLMDEIISETKKGLYLKDSSLEATSGSQNISVLVDQGFMIKNGEIDHPLKETMVGTTIFKLLKNIDAISKETFNESGSISPIIRVSTAKVAGGE